MGDGSPEFLGIAVVIHERMALDGGKDQDDEVPGRLVEELLVRSEIAGLDGGRPGCCGSVGRRDSRIARRRRRRWLRGRAILRLDEDGRRRVLEGDHGVHLSRAFVPGQKLRRVAGLVHPELDLEPPEDLTPEPVRPRGPRSAGRGATTGG